LGISLISMGVGFVAGGPSRTDTRKPDPAHECVPEPVSSRMQT
jgi:hypothetical protein